MLWRDSAGRNCKHKILMPWDRGKVTIVAARGFTLQNLFTIWELREKCCIKGLYGKIKLGYNGISKILVLYIIKFIIYNKIIY